MLISWPVVQISRPSCHWKPLNVFIIDSDLCIMVHVLLMGITSRLCGSLSVTTCSVSYWRHSVMNSSRLALWGVTCSPLICCSGHFSVTYQVPRVIVRHCIIARNLLCSLMGDGIVPISISQMRKLRAVKQFSQLSKDVLHLWLTLKPESTAVT